MYRSCDVSFPARFRGEILLVCPVSSGHMMSISPLNLEEKLYVFKSRYINFPAKISGEIESV